MFMFFKSVPNFKNYFPISKLVTISENVHVFENVWDFQENIWDF